jgi:hypothetical protein
MSKLHVRSWRHASCKKTARSAPLLHWVISAGQAKTKAKACRGVVPVVVCVVWLPHYRPRAGVIIVDVDLDVVTDLVVVDMAIEAMCVTILAALQHNDMGVSASPSVVFRLRFAPVPPKNRRDFPPAPLTLAGRCRYRIRARAPHEVVLRCYSAGHSPKAVVTGLKSTFPKVPRKSSDASCGAVQADTPLRYVTAFKLTIGIRHEEARMPRVVQTGAPCKGQGAPSRRPFQFGQTSKKEAPDTPLRYVTGFNII